MKVPATRTRVGRYEIGKTLGEGSFAKVKYARDVDTGDSVAIKVLDRDHVLRHKMVEQVWFLSLSNLPLASSLTAYLLMAVLRRLKERYRQ